METLLTRDGCVHRQQRLRLAMQAHRFGTFLTGHARTIYYLTGVLLPPESPAALVIGGEGKSVLISPATECATVDECVPVETYSISRVIADAHSDAARFLKDRIARYKDTTWTVEFSYTPAAFSNYVLSAPASDAGPMLRYLRKSKDEDEIAEIRRSLKLSAIAYDAAREAIRPGVTEIDVYSAMLDAATKSAAHTFTLAGDFACGMRCVRGGGPPTGNVVQPGDLYILDLFPACAFYFGDTCRTFAVGEPTPEQRRTWKLVAETLAMAEKMLRPGLAAKELYTAVRERLAPHEFGSSFWHHAGHGIGFHGHEAPRLIPGSDDVIEVGDVIAIEPALYSEQLRGGIRLENTYAIRHSGVERLFNYPLDL
jgi:Xaa-Pro dipeptidase